MPCIDRLTASYAPHFIENIAYLRSNPNEGHIVSIENTRSGTGIHKHIDPQVLLDEVAMLEGRASTARG